MAIILSKLLMKMRAYMHQGVLSLVLACVLGVVGLSTLIVSAASQVEPPRPQMSEQTSSVAKPTPSKNPKPELPTSIPVKLEIPSIDVISDMIQVAKNSDSTVEVPSGSDFDKAAWYNQSPTPGEKGSSVILGHVDSAKTGPSIFFNLGKLQTDDKIMVKRADNTTAVFKVDGIKEYSRDEFPTAEVYGASDWSTLKLITCSGEFNTATREYTNNIVAFASFVEAYPNR